jgi:hypothetical protein
VENFVTLAISVVAFLVVGAIFGTIAEFFDALFRARRSASALRRVLEYQNKAARNKSDQSADDVAQLEAERAVVARMLKREEEAVRRQNKTFTWVFAFTGLAGLILAILQNLDYLKSLFFANKALESSR